jgi:hypothetical protein
VTIQPPDPIIDPSDLTMRFAVGDPESRRSTTWSVVPQRNSGDVFIGARSQMGDTKLSLHRSGTWRLAFTKQSGRQTETGDRVIARYQPPPPVGDGLSAARRSSSRTQACAQSCEVGRMQLPDGLGMWIVANDVPSDAAHEAFLDKIRDEVRTRAAEVIDGIPFPTAMAWGTDDVGRGTDALRPRGPDLHALRGFGDSIGESHDATLTARLRMRGS